RRRTKRLSRAARSARVQRDVLRIVHAAVAITAASGVGTRCADRLASTTRERRCTSIVGMSIATGQASKQAPHNDDANGRLGLCSTPVSCGDRTAPIGPGYTEP